MAFIPVDDAAMARIEFALGTQTFSINPWFVKNAFSPTDLQALADAVDGIMPTELLDVLSLGVSYTGTRVYDMRTEGGPIAIADSGAGTGGIGTSPLPINVSAVLTLYSANRGRSGRGRLYIGGWDETQAANGVLDASVATNCTDFYTALQAAALAEGWTGVVVSKYHNGAVRPTPLAQPVISFEVRSLLPGTQRRRVDRP